MFSRHFLGCLFPFGGILPFLVSPCLTSTVFGQFSSSQLLISAKSQMPKFQTSSDHEKMVCFALSLPKQGCHCRRSATAGSNMKKKHSMHTLGLQYTRNEKQITVISAFMSDPPNDTATCSLWQVQCCSRKLQSHTAALKH